MKDNTQKKIKIQMSDNALPYPVKAEIIGRWAVHRAIIRRNADQPYEERDRYNITQISSGLAIVANIPNKTRALEIARKLEQELPDNLIGTREGFLLMGELLLDEGTLSKTTLSNIERAKQDE